ncbi:FepA family TonB-dependent siderophore receptor [Allosediminivita pacifica]|uniref:Ferric enterobactin receptor n=1 Tax=Allosediminivita pacifica TaxID=1267769 RepID=A0A2T6AW72_9RHOB|nr:FepA family TonB-dependent siderophore receptor [Allosediminivita pacifica]PTX48055.1 ferric enterobactin receptor [Allosediminivita pacifica]GGB11884.1 outer membrane receptor FepA [Allosediminivita pacifica]
MANSRQARAGGSFGRVLATTALAGALSATNAAAQDGTITMGDDGSMELGTIVIDAASEELKQALGASTITAEDVEEYLVTNDVSELVKTQPGVNLTGNTTTGQRGNNRQIDLRGMGPENTLILIDGRPALSRNSVRMGRSGERDTRGDSNWVPPSAIERIEVIRGPAAARYGSGSAGGVVNIITKAPTERETTVKLFSEVPESDKEGATYRANIVTSGPLTDRLSYRSYLSYNQSEGDDADINEDATDEGESVAAGSEGVHNWDFNTLLEFRPDSVNTYGVELGYSRQGNDYAGDALFQGVDRVDDSLIGEETNVMQRSTLALTHRGDYGFGEVNSYLQWEHTDNRRLNEGLAGGSEGLIDSTDDYNTALLDNVTAKSEWDIYSRAFGVDQTITLGAEYRGEWMNDPSSLEQGLGFENGESIPGTDEAGERDPESEAHLLGFYVESNMMLSDSFTLTPGVRVDRHSEAGVNWSPSLNASWEATSNITVKAGVSRAFKAPNLFQLNPNYVYRTRGRGCPVNYESRGNGCNILGNPDLEHETSWNKEIGIAYRNDAGWNAGLTYFKNDYENRIGASLEPELVVGPEGDQTQIFRWDNAPKAVVEGLEGNLLVPLADTLSWSTNATVMLRSENLQTGQPLSLVPDYTINSSLDWEYRPNWSFNLGLTHYGTIESPEKSVTNGGEIENREDRDPYTLVNLTTTYDFDNGLTLQGGVKNLFDTQVMREGTSNSAGANTYNEPGRSFIVSISKTF